MAKPNRELTPINGYLTFEPQVTERKVAISIVDDNTPEDDTPYTLVLYSPVGGARLDTTSAEFKMRLEGILLTMPSSLFLFLFLIHVSISRQCARFGGLKGRSQLPG